jgi:hypothetical protein
MKKLAALFIVVVAVSASTFAQGRNLAGAWTLDMVKTGPLAGAPTTAAGAARAGGPPKMFIKQTAKEMSVGMGSEANVVTFNLDGSDAAQKQGKSKMEWKGDKFVATLTSERGAMSLTFYREGAWLVVEEPAHGGNGVEKLYYAKAAAGK